MLLEGSQQIGTRREKKGEKGTRGFRLGGRGHKGRKEAAKKFHIPIYTCFAKFLWDARLGIIAFAKGQTKLVFLKKQVPKGVAV